MVLPLSVATAPQAGAEAGVQAGVTITVSADSVLLDPTLVQVPVTITCAPMEVHSHQGNAEIRQAVANQLIAFGSGFPEGPIVCDGQPHSNSYLFWVTTSGAPFARGSATVSIPLFLCDASFVCQSGSSGIRITQVRRPSSS